MTITCLPQILITAAYFVISGDVGLKLLNPGETAEGKQWRVMSVLLLYLYT